MFNRAIEWIKFGDQEPNKYPDTEDSGITVVEFGIDGSHIDMSCCWRGYIGQNPSDAISAWGSGKEIAMGAMGFGANATEACEVACQYESGCRGPVITLRPDFDEYKWVVEGK